MSSTGAVSNPASSFEPYRRYLLGLAYRMLRPMADAEDAVEETYLRWHGADRDRVSDPRASLLNSKRTGRLPRLLTGDSRTDRGHRPGVLFFGHGRHRLRPRNSGQGAGADLREDVTG